MFYGDKGDDGDLNSKTKLQYKDITIANDTRIQLNSASGSVITNANFISAYVIGTNNIFVAPYTYANLVYVVLKDVATMATVSAGNYTVRAWYKSE